VGVCLPSVWVNPNKRREAAETCVAQAGEKGAFRRPGVQNRWSEAIPAPWFASPSSNHEGNVSGSRSEFVSSCWGPEYCGGRWCSLTVSSPVSLKGTERLNWVRDGLSHKNGRRSPSRPHLDLAFTYEATGPYAHWPPHNSCLPFVDLLSALLFE
jgi:hypothetical protein